MTDIADIPRHRLVAPAGAGEQKTAVVQFGGCRQEELFDAPLAVGQPVRDETEIAAKSRLGRRRMVRRRVEPIVDRHAHPCAERFISGDDRRPAAIGEDDVVLRDQRMKRIGGIRADPFERRRCIDVPKEGDGTVTPQARNALFELPVDDAYNTRLYLYIGVALSFENLDDNYFL